MIPADGIRDDLNDASHIQEFSRTIRYRLVGEHVEAQPDTLEYTLKHLDDLQGQIVLPDIIKDFKDAWF